MTRPHATLARLARSTLREAADATSHARIGDPIAGSMHHWSHLNLLSRITISVIDRMLCIQVDRCGILLVRKASCVILHMDIDKPGDADLGDPKHDWIGRIMKTAADRIGTTLRSIGREHRAALRLEAAKRAVAAADQAGEVISSGVTAPGPAWPGEAWLKEHGNRIRRFPCQNEDLQKAACSVRFEHSAANATRDRLIQISIRRACESVDVPTDPMETLRLAASLRDGGVRAESPVGRTGR